MESQGKHQSSAREMLHTPDSEALSPSSSNSGDEMLDSLSGPPPITLINEKNYITLTEGCPAQLTSRELSAVVDQCRELVLKTNECTEERKWLVRRLIELRYQLQEAKENETEVESAQASETRIVLGHHFKLEWQPMSATKRVCDQCCNAILSVVQSWYQCLDCQYKCHVKCLVHIYRVCQHLKASELSKFEERICPEIGLDAQGYACAECHTHICFNSCRKDLYGLVQHLSALCVLPYNSNRISRGEPRRCDYNGLYYCSSCHWNNKTVIPARVMQNWDFTLRPVSRMAYQLLKLTRTWPIVQINESIAGFVDELCLVKKVREDLIMMKQYLIQCRNAQKEHLPWQLVNNKQYILADCEFYSIRDLIELNEGILLIKLKDIRDKFEKHIKVDCKICSGQGYMCELCKSKHDKDVVFPFDATAYSCPSCHWVYHKNCYQTKQSCPRCLRLQQRRSKCGDEDDDEEAKEATETLE